MTTATAYTYHERTVTPLRCACGAFWSYRLLDLEQDVDFKKCRRCETIWLNGKISGGNGKGKE